MKKIIVIALLFLNNCTSTPIVDSRGGSGNIEHQAERMHDDMYTCKEIAKDNTNALWEGTKKVYNITRAKVLWLTPKAEDNYKLIMENCLEGRGHQVLIWK